MRDQIKITTEVREKNTVRRYQRHKPRLGPLAGRLPFLGGSLLGWLGDSFNYTARLGFAKNCGLLDNGRCLLIVSTLEEQR